MQLFISDHSYIESARNLDDRRLIKQILECWQVAHGQFENHPITKYYANSRNVLMLGIACCCEYSNRFRHTHKLENEFVQMSFEQSKVWCRNCYIKGRKGKDQVITTDNVYERYKQLLATKWQQDTANGRPPKWTNRNKPDWVNDKYEVIK